MLAKLHSVAITGIDAVPVEVELDHNFGLPCERLVGLPDKAVQEALDRIKSALRNRDYDFPASRRLIFSLAPAELRKEGAVYDLPLALVTLIASGQLSGALGAKFLVMGELSLGGELRPVRGALAAAITARQLGMEGVMVPLATAAEAAAVEGVRAVGVSTLTEAVGFFAGEWSPSESYGEAASEKEAHPLCYSDMRGQESVKRAMLVAAAGAHHCLLMGPPGSGKTMAAQRLPSILPPPVPAGEPRHHENPQRRRRNPGRSRPDARAALPCATPQRQHAGAGWRRYHSPSGRDIPVPQRRPLSGRGAGVFPGASGDAPPATRGRHDHHQPRFGVGDLPGPHAPRPVHEPLPPVAAGAIPAACAAAVKSR